MRVETIQYPNNHTMSAVNCNQYYAVKHQVFYSLQTKSKPKTTFDNFKSKLCSILDFEHQMRPWWAPECCKIWIETKVCFFLCTYSQPNLTVILQFYKSFEKMPKSVWFRYCSSSRWLNDVKNGFRLASKWHQFLFSVGQCFRDCSRNGKHNKDTQRQTHWYKQTAWQMWNEWKIK